MNPRIDLPETTHQSTRRPPWRQRLAQAERGFVGGMRADSTLFAHFFAWVTVGLIGLVLKLSWHYWVQILMFLAFALTAELFHQAFRTLVYDEGRVLEEKEQHALGLAASGSIVAAGTAVIAITIILFQRFQHVL